MNDTATKTGSKTGAVALKAKAKPEETFTPLIHLKRMDQTFGTPLVNFITHNAKLRKNGYSPDTIAQK